MSARKINTFIGAVLLVALVVKVADLLAGAVETPPPPAKPAYVLGGAAPGAEAPAETAAKAPEKAAEKAAEKTPENAAEAKPAAKPAGITALLAAANADKGKGVARKCTTCHSLKKGGKHKVGPALWGIVGADKARGTFRFSKALKGLGGKWDYAALDGFLKDPRAFAPGNKMTFPGVKGANDRAALILYLRSLSDSPVPLP